MNDTRQDYLECTVHSSRWEGGVGVARFVPRNTSMNLAVKGQTSSWRHVFKMLSASIFKGFKQVQV